MSHTSLCNTLLGLSTIAIVGIVIGVVVFLGIVGGIVACVMCCGCAANAATRNRNTGGQIVQQPPTVVSTVGTGGHPQQAYAAPPYVQYDASRKQEVA